MKKGEADYSYLVNITSRLSLPSESQHWLLCRLNRLWGQVHLPGPDFGREELNGLLTMFLDTGPAFWTFT